MSLLSIIIPRIGEIGSTDEIIAILLREIV
jgi:hypothetical protein